MAKTKCPYCDHGKTADDKKCPECAGRGFTADDGDGGSDDPPPNPKGGVGK